MATGNLLPDNTASMETSTAGWVTLLNASTLVRVTGGTSGAYCLGWTAPATGTTQTSAAARVPVTAGVEYWACASVFPPAVAAQSGIDVRWYSAAGSLISTTTGPTTAAPDTTWHQVGAIGTAPAGAVTALVVVRATATVAGQKWYIDRVHLGPTSAMRTAGTLLPWAVESAETGTSGWSAGASSALSVSPLATSGYQSLLVTSTAAGPATASSAAPVPVTVGTEYMLTMWVQTSAGGAFQPTATWLTTTGDTVSTSTASWSPTASAWTRCSVIAKAPAGAASVRVGVSATATGAGQAWAVDGVALMPTSTLVQTGNLIPYGDAAFEVEVTGWDITGGTRSRASVQRLDGSYSYRAERSGTSDLTLTLATPVPVTPGVAYQTVAPLWRSDGSGTYTTRMEWLSATGDVVRTREHGWASSAGAWQQGSSSDVAPASAVALRPSLILPPDTGATIYMDRLYVGAGGLAVTATETASGSAEVRLQGLTVGGPDWLWSLVRLQEGQAEAPVRGYSGDLVDQSITGDVAVVLDHEAPLGSPVQWRLRVRQPAASGMYSYTSDPLTLDAPTMEVWIKDPTLPARACRGVVQKLPDWQRSARQGISEVRGRSRPIVISDVRSSRTGSLTLTTQTSAERDAVWWVLDSGNTVLLQWPPEWREGDAYVSVGDATEARIVDVAEYTDRVWTLALTEVDRPVGGMVGSPTRTWQTLADAGESWTDAIGPAMSWLDVLTGVTGG